MNVRKPLPVALAVSTISCALPPIDYDGDGFRHHEALELVALSADRFNEATFDGIARAATLDDLARLVDDGAAHAPIDVDEAFVLEGAVVAGLSEPQPLLFSFHRLAADGTREVLFLPASGDSLAGSIQRSGWEGTLTVDFRDTEGPLFAATAGINVALEGAPARVASLPDADGRVDATDCGHRRERLLAVTCIDSNAEPVRVRIGETATACGLELTNHAAWAVESDWICTDSVDPVVWSAIRPPR